MSALNSASQLDTESLKSTLDTRGKQLLRIKSNISRDEAHEWAHEMSTFHYSSTFGRTHFCRHKMWVSRIELFGECRIVWLIPTLVKRQSRGCLTRIRSYFWCKLLQRSTWDQWKWRQNKVTCLNSRFGSVGYWVAESLKAILAFSLEAIFGQTINTTVLMRFTRLPNMNVWQK